MEEELSSKLLYHVLDYLQTESLENIFNFCCSNSQLQKEIWQNDVFWKILFQRNFGDVEKESDDWKRTYKEYYNVKKKLENSTMPPQMLIFNALMSRDMICVKLLSEQIRVQQSTLDCN